MPKKCCRTCVQKLNRCKYLLKNKISAASAPLRATLQMKNTFIHHVFFWLKNSGSAEDKQALIAGLQKLAAASTIQSFHIGTAAATSRGVIDNTYSVSWMLFFADAAAQDAYQTDPVHLQFVNECSHLWEKVVVYDSIDV